MPIIAAWQRYCLDTRQFSLGRSMISPKPTHPKVVAKPKNVSNSTKVLCSSPSLYPCNAFRKKKKIVTILLKQNNNNKIQVRVLQDKIRECIFRRRQSQKTREEFVQLEFSTARNRAAEVFLVSCALSSLLFFSSGFLNELLLVAEDDTEKRIGRGSQGKK